MYGGFRISPTGGQTSLSEKESSNAKIIKFSYLAVIFSIIAEFLNSV